ncbi:isoaspartyl peptidase/L-asparaginase [Erythrobacter arachoides]|uniref:Isoaspartyl peptidase n=1 Tax=Aurantiacibacter arachoides TaxID=1850444 RepID=A0A845A0H1_9SPHN|nr:isoaspartyl peptidase/L-asparaginase [Aurantiacibacter arachoides]MXO92972.1 isoaspartyl peptidase/L-asparaginase [Aurantiacibacter arachoides]GGD53054.1 isoaspartyl peptidase/L-asparaginase [Aurantiacibacter arachoides]
MARLPKVLASALALSVPAGVSAQAAPQAEWSIAIHGGAGTLSRDAMTPAREAEYTAALQAALDAGAAVLRDGGEAQDAVVAVVTLLEDDPLFNAGRGAVLTWEGGVSLDASFMRGDTRAAGAAAGLAHVRHPILLARAIMEDGRHVFLSGEGAEEFAADQGLERAETEWFITPRRRDSLEQFRAAQDDPQVTFNEDAEHRYGTVGAVARDVRGNLAAGTSTGGTTGKRWGRIGDSPVIGAGTYADNRACAVSATGTGEYFLRAGVAQGICALMRLSGMGPQEAADQLIVEVGDMGGDGGVIVVSAQGEAAFSFNTSGMYRGRADSNGLNEVAIFTDSPPVDPPMQAAAEH